MPTLMLNFPEGETSTFAVTGAEVTFGRGQSNEISINEKHVSSFHAKFHRREDGFYDLVDLESHNGTYVNGVRITGRHRLKEGDRLVFGMIEGKYLHTHPELAGAFPEEELQLTQGIEIAFLRTAEAIRSNPELARAAAHLQKQVDLAEAYLVGRELSSGGTAEHAQHPGAVFLDPQESIAKLERDQSGEMAGGPDPTADPAALEPRRIPPPAPVPNSASPPTPTPTLPRRKRPILNNIHTPVPSPRKAIEPPPVSFLPAEIPPPPLPTNVKSPFTIAPPDSFPKRSGDGLVPVKAEAPSRKRPFAAAWKSLLPPS